MTVTGPSRSRETDSGQSTPVTKVSGGYSNLSLAGVHIIPFLIPNGSGVESTIRGMKTHFLYHSELWQVCLCTYTTLKKCVLHSLINTTQI